MTSTRLQSHRPLIALLLAALAWAVVLAAAAACFGCQPQVKISPAKSHLEAVRQETKPKTTRVTETTITIKPKGAAR